MMPNLTVFIFPLPPSCYSPEAYSMYLTCRVELISGLKTGVLVRRELRKRGIGSLLASQMRGRLSLLKGRLTFYPQGCWVGPLPFVGHNFMKPLNSDFVQTNCVSAQSLFGWMRMKRDRRLLSALRSSCREW